MTELKTTNQLQLLSNQQNPSNKEEFIENQQITKQASEKVHIPLPISSPSFLPLKIPAPIYPFLFRPRTLSDTTINYYHMPLQQLDFKVIHATDWDENYPPEALVPKVTSHLQNKNGGVKHGKGWQSPRLCAYPQEIILQLASGSARVLKLQILSHHYKIASKLDIYVGSVQRRKEMAGMANSNTIKQEKKTLTWEQMPKIIDYDSEEGNNTEELEKVLDDDTDIHLDKLNDESYVHFRRLGYCALDSNERAQYKARELKSVRLDAECEYIRLVARRCHSNHLNQFNQVGLVGITVMGEPIDDLLEGESQTIPLEQADEDVSRVASPETCDIPVNRDLQQWPSHNISPDYGKGNFGSLSSIISSSANNNVAPEKPIDFLQDEGQTATLLAAFGRGKEAAVKGTNPTLWFFPVEDFHMAKVLKDSIELVQKCSQEIIKLGGLKKQAVEKEDFDSAAKFKASREIEEIKTAVQTTITDEGIQLDENGEVIVYDIADIVGLAEHPQVPPFVENLQVPTPTSSTISLESMRKISNSSIDPFESAGRDKQKRQNSRQIKSSNDRKQISVITNNLGRPSSPLRLSKSRTSSNASRMNAPAFSSATVSDQEPLTPTSPTKTNPAIWESYEDERPIPALANNKSCLMAPVPSDDLAEDEPEELSDLARSAFALSVQVFGDQVVACLLSKKFKWRETALTDVTQRLDAESEGHDVEGIDKSILIKAAFQIMQEGLNDNREKLTLQAINLWATLTHFCVHHQVPQSVTSKLVDQTFPALFSKISDTNPRIKQSATDLFILLSKTYRSPNQSVISLVLKPSHSQTQPPKQSKAKVELITQLVEVFGIALIPKGKFEKDNGLSLDGVMEVAVSYLNHSNGEVRDAAVKLVVEVCKCYDKRTVESYLNGVKPLLIENIRKLTDAFPPPPPIMTMLEVDESLLKKPLAKRGTFTRLEQQLMEAKAMINNVNHFVADDFDTYIANTIKHAPAGSYCDEDHPDNTSTISAFSHAPAEVTQRVNSVAITTASKKTATGRTTKSSPSTTNKPSIKKTRKADEPTDSFPSPSQPGRQRSSSKLSATSSTRGTSIKVNPTGHVRRGSTEEEKSPSQIKTSTKPIPKTVAKPMEPPTPIVAPEPEEGSKSDRCCIFCDEHSDDFTEENLVTHYWNECPVLTNCPLCNIILEISTLDDHMLNDCDKSKFVKQCPRCREVIRADNYLEHVANQTCMVIPSHIVRCPLCKSVVKPATEAGWKAHLLDMDGCPKNLRKNKTLAPPVIVATTHTTTPRESSTKVKRAHRSSNNDTTKSATSPNKTASRKVSPEMAKDKTKKPSNKTRVKAT
ncbi:hypothetical protein G9A89_020147 [Geosiphon pyriformis]|nr:hypothetical protein G9A89_020147 [Geosiphon pyriformis]